MRNTVTKRVSRKPVMRNKILTLTETPIPYVKELRRLKSVKSITACLLMQQLDYWFERNPQSFYKFLAPCEAIGYRQGDSWREELGFSADEFRNAFDQIGVRYKSKKEFDEAANKFLARNRTTGEVEEKYYCSYFDKIRRQTFYFRNHAVVDAALDSISSAEAGEAEPYGTGEAISRDWERQATELGEGKPEYTKITTQTTSDITQEREGLASASSHSGNVFEDNTDASLESSSIMHTAPTGPPRPSVKPRATLMPKDFRLTRDMLFWAGEEACHVDVREATQKFIDYYRSHPKKSADWVAEWRNWMRRELEYERNRQRDDNYNTNRQGDSVSSYMDVYEAILEYVQGSDCPVSRSQIDAEFSDLSEQTISKCLEYAVENGDSGDGEHGLVLKNGYYWLPESAFEPDDEQGELTT